jgi:hypothetical protein
MVKRTDLESLMNQVFSALGYEHVVCMRKYFNGKQN